ncbi:gpi mannosyltransferase 2 [Trichoderma arundinaceum]|uniref:GPI mannosyltransferase 2 n=1 Tax=Trichoderma arundinaceum TaxID=490622 RepID=A0A395NVX6_TRIAR|nr:gpi mannosyltransferase 2 [Trichoderma arundinaceum]
MKLIPYSESQPLRSLLAIFAAWKAFLLAIALGTAVSDDYDTSTSLFFEHVYGSGVKASPIATKLTRWDSLYFMQTAHDGYIYEQQWAFGAALPLAVRGILQPFKMLQLVGNAAIEPLVAIIFTTLSHLVAVLALHKLTLDLFNNKRLAFVAAVLHILSPAGLFLSAPCGESPFACLSFIGNLLFATGLQPNAATSKRILAFLGAGAFFGVSISFRSNGLISGVLFAVEATRSLFTLFRQPSFSRLAILASLIIGGLSIAAGSAVPQAVAWLRYCKSDLVGVEPRPWCSRLVPSIYTFVQEHYWNNGFLRYWTPNQLPLFLLASPVLILLIKSGLETLVAILAITHFHVQIITRMSSGYPIWYWWVANSLIDGKSQKTGSKIVVFMIIYATSTVSQEIQYDHKHDASNDIQESDSDLTLWLQHTGYFDVEHRRRILTALRELKALDEQRCEILAEIRAATDYIVSPCNPTTPQSSYSPSFSTAHQMDQSTLNGFSNYNNLLTSHAMSLRSSDKLYSSQISLVSSKRADSENGYMACIQQHRSSAQQAQPDTEAAASPFDSGYESQGAKSKSPASERTDETEACQNYGIDNKVSAQILKLTPKQGAQYFLVKSFNTTNVEMSQQDGLWITAAKNGPVFTHAFNQHKDVFLIFSVNKSKAFQGYARMTTAPHANIARAKWMASITWAASHPFRVEWLNTRSTEFWRMGDLKNPLKDGAPVFVGRDGQEYPESCGRKIIEILDRGSGRRSAASSSCVSRRGYNDAKLARSRPGPTVGKDEILAWQHEDLAEGDEPDLANTVPEPVCDMPLIEY